jgi:hypothetical protein
MPDHSSPMVRHTAFLAPPSLLQSRLFAWRPTRETLRAAAAALLCCVAGPLIWRTTGRLWLHLLAGDVALLAGAVWFITRRLARPDGGQTYGIHADRADRFLCLGMLLGAAVFAAMLPHSPTPYFYFNHTMVWQSAYLLLTGIGGGILVFGCIRVEFSRAWGLVPAALVAAWCWAALQTGYGPDFWAFGCIGLVLVLLVHWSNSWLTVFPFAWGVLACRDTLVLSREVPGLTRAAERSWLLAAGLLLTGAWLWWYRRKNPGFFLRRLP